MQIILEIFVQTFVPKELMLLILLSNVFLFAQILQMILLLI